MFNCYLPLSTSLKALSPYTVTLEVRALTYTFWKGYSSAQTQNHPNVFPPPSPLLLNTVQFDIRASVLTSIRYSIGISWLIDLSVSFINHLDRQMNNNWTAINYLHIKCSPSIKVVLNAMSMDNAFPFVWKLLEFPEVLTTLFWE